jgi:prepilin signal peptidase PulO-like enzyme (type II secretory pathway)
MILNYILIAGLGLLVGGLINALADDLPYRRRLGVPSYPDGTPRPLTAWYGLSAFLLGQRQPQTAQPDAKRKREHESDNRMGWRHPLTELLTAFLFVVAYAGMQRMGDVSLAQQVLYLLYMAIFALITVIDIEHKLILFIVAVPSIVLAFLDALFLPETGPTIGSALSGALAGFATFFAMFLGGILFNVWLSRRRGEDVNTVAFGFGDVVLIVFSGALLGLENIFFGLFVTIFLGAMGASLYIVIKQLFVDDYEAFTAIPYGPYIVAGTIIILLYAYPVQCAIWNWSLEGPCL